jgi:2-keto-4-pentenoate hydratase
MSTFSIDVSALARELFEARAAGQPVAVPPSEREGGLPLEGAYAVEAELTRLRRDQGHTTVGRKVGYANKAMWRVLKLQTLVWANMYDDTVCTTPAAGARRCRSPGSVRRASSRKSSSS